MKKLKILAIETSCDETSTAVVENGSRVLSNIVSSQIDLHKKYGGVVPEIASRAHIENIIPVVQESLDEAKVDWKDIDAIAVTKGPGLLGSLLVGVNIARTLAYLKNKPLIPVHHIEGHIYANFIRNDPAFAKGYGTGRQFPISNTQSNINDKMTKKDSVQSRMTAEKFSSDQRLVTSDLPKFPIIALIVSGGHTSLILMKDHLKYKILGQTIDDAAGEVFDKVAKILELGYPGGPIVSKLAEDGDVDAYDFPRTDLTPGPKRDKSGYLVYPKPSLDFSFSGLKTAVLNEVRKKLTVSSWQLAEKNKGYKSANRKLQTANLVASFQQTAIDILVRNSVNAIKMYKPKSFLLCGGVAANKELRLQLEKAVKKEKVSFSVPDFSLSTDNAAMIGAAAYYHMKKKTKFDWKKVNADPNLKLTG